MLNKSKTKKSIGFGFIPEESQFHFLVEIPREGKNNTVRVFERPQWLDGEQEVDYRHDTIKVALSLDKWHRIKDTIRNEFKPRLKAKKYSQGKWMVGKIPVHRLLGKELVLLAWVVADCDPTVIDTALKNWLGLRPEERWWLYTMTNATSGGVDDNFGWRKAIRYALTENPVIDDKKRQSLFYFASQDEI